MQEQTPLISVIMPLYNAERFVGESIENVLRQTVGDFELIVIDDASTDASAEIARAYAAKDDRIVLMHNELNSGAARTRNRALDAARGKFITFMDADDLCSPERFAKQLAFFEQHPQTDICGSYYTMFGTRGGVMAN
ncbi:glycosyltransferase family 2 protein [Alistipes finegoldii]|uniref:glycosyltransferase family 2 protein n=1 Tax=Alistipes finegoldii TaxID=214856 RepID=UPI00242A6C0B|nr:glycosyltransferase family 2 protein [Alistipes finegoldii]